MQHGLNIPFISICGGREPENIIGYKNGISLDNVGNYDCCLTKGCRNKGFSDLDDKRKCKYIFTDENNDKCGLCMKEITPAQIQNYLN